MRVEWRSLARALPVVLLLTQPMCLAAENAALPARSGHHLPGVAEKDGTVRRLTLEDLQRELFEFADRYREHVGQVTDEGVLRAKNAGMRVLYQATKTSYVSSAVSVVTGPRPLDALRDLLVMVSLQRMVWASGAGGKIAPEDAEPVARALATLEAELYELAARVVPAEAIAKLRSLIEQWRRENPDQHYVAFVRFQNLGASPVVQEVEDVISSGGFLAPVESVAREAHEARLLAERTLYLANRMPMLLEWQTTLAYQRIVASPEAAGLVEDLHSYRSALERLGREVNELPAKVADELKALLTDVAQLIAKERAQTLRAIEMLVRREREATFAALSKGADTYGPIVQQLAVTAAATRDAVAGLERLMASPPGKPDNGESMRRLQQTAEQLAAAAQSTNSVVSGLNTLFSAELQGLTSLDALLASQIQRLFIYGALLVLLIGAVAYVLLRAARRPAI